MLYYFFIAKFDKKMFKGPIPPIKKLRSDQEPKVDNPWKSILLVKPLNSKGNRRCRTLTLSGGAPHVRWSSAFHHVLVFSVKF